TMPVSAVFAGRVNSRRAACGSVFQTKTNGARTGSMRVRARLSGQTASESRVGRGFGLSVPVVLDDFGFRAFGQQSGHVRGFEPGLVEGEAIVEGIDVARGGLFDAGDNLVGGNGIGQVHGKEGDVDRAQPVHFRRRLGVGGEIDAGAGEIE